MAARELLLQKLACERKARRGKTGDTRASEARADSFFPVKKEGCLVGAALCVSRRERIFFPAEDGMTGRSLAAGVVCALRHERMRFCPWGRIV